MFNRYSSFEFLKKYFIIVNFCWMCSIADGYSYNIIISAFYRSGWLKEAKELAKEYEVTYKRYDLVILNAFLRAYCNTSKMENVMQTLKKMDEWRISLDWNTFQILVKYFFKDKLYHLAYKTVEDMHAKGHNLSAVLTSPYNLKIPDPKDLDFSGMRREKRRSFKKLLVPGQII